MIMLYTTHEKQEIATKHLENRIKHLEKWCDKCKRLLIAGKTVYIIFSTNTGHKTEAKTTVRRP